MFDSNFSIKYFQTNKKRGPEGERFSKQVIR
jgi:hypothetical protein